MTYLPPGDLLRQIRDIVRELQVDDPAFETEERVLWDTKANRTQSRMRAVGGKLFLTDRRLVFASHRFDAKRGGEDWSVRLADIQGLDTASRDLRHFFGGGLRRRLRVTTAAGEELFVLNGVANAIDIIRVAVDASQRRGAGRD